MKPVDRSEILDYVTYDERRAELRPRAMAAKATRRVVLAGGTLTFLFENRDTVRYQVQEMMRTERIVKEADVLHELHTYNELLGGPGELGCTLLIEIDDPAAHELGAALIEPAPERLPPGRPAQHRRPRAAALQHQVGELHHHHLGSLVELHHLDHRQRAVAVRAHAPGNCSRRPRKNTRDILRQI
mgnify:CR=1 FL=1